MFVRLHLQSPGFNLQTVLQAEALPALVELVQKYRVTDLAALQRLPRGDAAGPGQRMNPRRGMDHPAAPSVTVALNEASTATRTHLTETAAETLFAPLAAATFPEKLLVATGWLEAHQSATGAPHRREVKRLLVRLGHEPPANPGRDFRTAWNEGWVVEAGVRCLTVTNEGWAKIQSLITPASES